MHILLIHQYYCPPGGWGNDRSRDFARHWAQQGHRVTVLTTQAYFPPDQRSPQLICKKIEGCTVLALPVAYEQSMRFHRRIWAFVSFFFRGIKLGMRLPNSEAKPDLIYASSTPPTVGWMGRLLARWHTCPWFFEVVDVWPQVPIGMGIIKNRLLQSLLHALTEPLYRSARKTFALSDGMREQILARNISHRFAHNSTRNFLPDRVSVIMNGTSAEHFRPAEESGPPLRLVYIGAVGRANGLHLLAAAARNVLAKRPDVVFEIRGWGSHWGALQAETADLPGFVCLPPVPKEELPAWLSGAAVGVCVFAPFPVLEANSANKFYDYMASGLPVVLNYGGWQARVLDENGCGLWAPQNDPQAFCKALLQLIDLPDLRREMGNAARLWATTHADRQHLAQQTLDEMQEVLRNG